MSLKASQIAQLIPHTGEMCLLESVFEWSEHRIRCLGRSHRDSSNPLRVGGRFHATSAIEYAAQTMAAHGALTGRTRGRPRAGYLVSLREIVCHALVLGDLAGSLTVDAERLLEDPRHVTYGFKVQIGDTEVVTGRAMVILDEDAA